MSREALVSCIVPVHNGGRFLSQTLDSVLAQAYRPLEVITVDDGSTDHTPDILSSYGDRIRYRRQSREGAAAARNAGLQLAQGEFVAFLDADDLWLPGKLQRQMARFGREAALGLLFTRIVNVRIESEPGSTAQTTTVVSEHSPYSLCTVVARRDVFDRVGPFDPDLQMGEDMEWFMRAMRFGELHDVLDEILVHRRLHDSNLTRTGHSSADDRLRMLKSVLDAERARED